MPLDERELLDDAPGGRGGFARRGVANEEDDSGGSPIFAIVGGVAVLAVLGALGYFIVTGAMSVSNQAAMPQNKSTVNKLRPASQTPFGVDVPVADASRYKGDIDTYYLRPLDKTRELVAVQLNNQNMLLDAANEIESGGVGSAKKKNKRPGPGCTEKEVQDYFEERGFQFPELPDDLIWGYNTKTGECYLGKR